KDDCFHPPAPPIANQLPIALQDMHWCIDKEADWEFLNNFMPAVIARYGPAYTMHDAYQILLENPAWLAINHLV
ncbi:MAG: hypothetical protein AAF352_01255, partial [Pseudomonadota bacterium]